MPRDGRKASRKGEKNFKGPWEVFGGDGHVHGLDCGDGFVGLYICQFVGICKMVYFKLYLNIAIFKRWTEVRKKGVHKNIYTQCYLKSGFQRRGMFNKFNTHKIPF